LPLAVENRKKWVKNKEIALGLLACVNKRSSFRIPMGEKRSPKKEDCGSGLDGTQNGGGGGKQPHIRGIWGGGRCGKKPGLWMRKEPLKTHGAFVILKSSSSKQKLPLLKAKKE